MTRQRTLIPSLLVSLSLLPICGILADEAHAQKIRPEELIARHLKAIGATDSSSARQSLLAQGVGEFKILAGGEATAAGEAQLVSQGRNVRFTLVLGRSDYPGEDCAVLNDDIGVAYTTAGRRSLLGEFFLGQKAILREGLLGGTLSAAWPLAALEERDKPPKLKYKGLKKVDGIRLHALSYQPRRTSLRITLYFDPDDFLHVRTSYDLRIPAPPPGTPEASAGLRDTRIKVEEIFDSFQDAEGLLLPTLWRLKYSGTGNSGGAVWQWTMKFEKITLGGEFPLETFQIKH